MVKKLTVLVVALIMVFTFAACDNGLTGYKDSAKTELQDFAGGLDEDDYSEANWEIICGLVTSGMAAIDEATDETSVDSALALAKQEIDEVMTIEETELAEYKIAKKTELQAFADGLDEGDYSEENWEIICGLVTAGMTAIEAATTKSAVTKAYDDAKDVIDDIDKEGIGMFYTLQEAYDEGLLTVQDLQAIADFLNGGTASATELSGEIIELIKETAAIDMRNKEPALETKSEDFNILKYYGTYNESVAVILNDPYHEYPMEIVDICVEVAGVSFHYVGHGTITIWTKK